MTNIITPYTVLDEKNPFVFRIENKRRLLPFFKKKYNYYSTNIEFVRYVLRLNNKSRIMTRHKMNLYRVTYRMAQIVRFIKNWFWKFMIPVLVLVLGYLVYLIVKINL